MKIGKQTIKLDTTPRILETSSAVGPKESNGPLGIYFDIKCSDIFFGEKTFEKAESKFMKKAIDNLLFKSGIKEENIDYIFGGDLLNQCIATGYCMRDLGIPFFRFIRSLFNFYTIFNISIIICKLWLWKKSYCYCIITFL